jgi:hypothetical protein
MYSEVGSRRESPFFLFLGGAFAIGQAAQRAHQKNTTDLPLAGPDQAQSLRLSPSRSIAGRCDPRRRRTQHPSRYLRQAPHRRQTHWRATSNWPPPPCPLHGATQPLPTPVEHTSAYQGGPAFAPATPQPPPRCRMWNICTPTAAYGHSFDYSGSKVICTTPYPQVGYPGTQCACSEAPTGSGQAVSHGSAIYRAHQQTQYVYLSRKQSTGALCSIY